MSRPKILVFASGSAEGGGSGFQRLVEASREGPLKADIVGVVSNHPQGGVMERALKLGVRFSYFPGPWDPRGYQYHARESGAEFFALSGWIKLVKGLDMTTLFNPQTVFNIHPGPLPNFGGKRMYGHHVHESVIAAYRRGELTHSAVCMHFVTGEYDRGPVFFHQAVPIEKDDTPESLGKRVNREEHRLQPLITNMVVNGLIRWNGASIDYLQTPPGYAITHVG